jgi:hypothetical protein
MNASLPRFVVCYFPKTTTPRSGGDREIQHNAQKLQAGWRAEAATNDCDQRKSRPKAAPSRMITVNGSDVLPVVMMTTMMASTPSIVVASTAVMAPAMTTAVAVTVDLDD